MKTVGQLLHAARKSKGLSLDQLSSLTKIDVKYISALEDDNYSSLPSETFVKGFIRNLSIRLDCNPDELISIFRRDYRIPAEGSKTIRRKQISGFGNLTSSHVLPFILGGIVFTVYLIFQFRAILSPPKLDIVRPSSGSVLVSPIEIEGTTDVDASISVGNDIQAKPDNSGHFLVRVSLPIGETTLEIKSVNRFSRTATKKIPLIIVSQ
jgi:cytoskeletal protein RodZ